MSQTDLQGKTFLVTGASSGLGAVTVDALAARGATVVAAARSEEKIRPVLDGLRSKHANAELHFMQMDLVDLVSVKRAAEGFLASGRRLDVLVNNAGLAGARGLTRDGWEIAYATNHLGPFLLTDLLLPRLREAPQGRVVNVSSHAHYMVKQVDWERLRRAATSARDSFAQYGLTKLFNVLHAKELARRLAGTAVTTYSLHPGAVATDVWRELPRPLQWILKLFLLTREEGARTQVYCATDASLATVSGRYYYQLREEKVNPLADDEALARELFSRSEEAIRTSLAKAA